MGADIDPVMVADCDVPDCRDRRRHSAQVVRIFEAFRLDDAARLPANLDTSTQTIGHGC